MRLPAILTVEVTKLVVRGNVQASAKQGKVNSACYLGHRTPSKWTIEVLTQLHDSSILER